MAASANTVRKHIRERQIDYMSKKMAEIWSHCHRVEAPDATGRLVARGYSSDSELHDFDLSKLPEL